jgi:hypothetical protein
MATTCTPVRPILVATPWTNSCRPCIIPCIGTVVFGCRSRSAVHSAHVIDSVIPFFLPLSCLALLVCVFLQLVRTSLVDDEWGLAVASMFDGVSQELELL